MKEKELYDKVKYAKGDKVRRKYREDDERDNFEIVDRCVEVTNIDGFRFMIVYFTSKPTSPFVSAEFEPCDKNERKAYYEHWEEAKSLLSETKTKAKGKSKSKAKTFKMKI
jgi:hypothetical protein